MTYVLLMQIAYTFTYLPEEYSSLILWKYSLRSLDFDVLIQADSTYKLLYQVDVLGSFKVFKKFHAVRVIYTLHTGDLSLNCLALSRIVKLILRVNLDSHLLLSLLVLSKLHIGIGTLT